MSIKDINNALIRKSTGLFAKIAYGFNYTYSPYEFLKLRQFKKHFLESKLSKRFK